LTENIVILHSIKSVKSKASEYLELGMWVKSERRRVKSEE